MAVKLDKIPLNRFGKPLRMSDTITPNCGLGQHIGHEPRRGTFGWIDACDGVASRLGVKRACACNCHRERN